MRRPCFEAKHVSFREARSGLLSIVSHSFRDPPSLPALTSLVGYTTGGDDEWTGRDLDEIFNEIDTDGSGMLSIKELARALKVTRNAEFKAVRIVMPPEPELPPQLKGYKRELLRLGDQYERQMKGQEMCPASFADALRLYWPLASPQTINVSAKPQASRSRAFTTSHGAVRHCECWSEPTY